MDHCVLCSGDSTASPGMSRNTESKEVWGFGCLMPETSRNCRSVIEILKCCCRSWVIFQSFHLLCLLQLHSHPVLAGITLFYSSVKEEMDSYTLNFHCLVPFCPCPSILPFSAPSELLAPTVRSQDSKSFEATHGKVQLVPSVSKDGDSTTSLGNL